MRLKYIFQETEERHKNGLEMGYYRTENTFSIVVRKTDCYQQLKVGRRKSAFYCPPILVRFPVFLFGVRKNAKDFSLLPGRVLERVIIGAYMDEMVLVLWRKNDHITLLPVFSLLKSRRVARKLLCLAS